MYIETVPNRNSPPAVLLREGHRRGAKVIKRTIANLSSWPKAKVDTLRKLLKNEPLVSPDQVFKIERSWPHGHVEAVLETIQRLGLDRMIAAKRCPERDLVMAMIIERLIQPGSKLAAARTWDTTTLAQLLDLDGYDEEDLYAAMDWLYQRQHRIEKKLANRHLSNGDQVLYDVSSSYYEGRHCSLADFGHNRDQKKGKRIVVYGMLCDVEGRPIAVQVYPGNTGDPSTVPDQVTTLRDRFALTQVTLVGDRGMLTQAQIQALKDYPGIGWISACRNRVVRDLVAEKHLQLSLFDSRNLAEIQSPDFPGERLIACFNPLLAEERQRKREALLTATEQALAKIQRQVQRRTKTPLSAVEIGEKVGRVIHQHKMAKHFELTINDGQFEYQRRQGEIDREIALDGIYVIRTSEPAAKLSADDAVRSYKNLARVEQVFRTVKGVEIRVRPIHHRLEERVRSHIFICLLAYYVEWHMRQALAPLLFDDETVVDDRKQRDPVATVQPTARAKQKKRQRTTDDGLPIHSFTTLLRELATICRVRCRVEGTDMPPIYQHPEPTPLQRKVRDLLRVFPG